jgi:alpha-L-fucosidase 2
MAMAVKKGEVKAVGEHLICEKADQITIYVAAATSFREPDVRSAVKNKLEKALEKDYETIKKDHIHDYRQYFDTCRLELDYDASKDRLTTDERLHAISKENSDGGLIQTYFDFGRYLLISSSRPGTLPANLQGIWNPSMTPPWGSKYTININTEMNYWPSEVLGLSKCHEPLFDLLKRMEKRGRKTAETMYGCRGFVAHHNTDLWADTAPQDMYIPATYWVMGGAWLCTHIWEHYEFSGDETFLREMYPVIKSAVLFFLDFLVEKDGEYVTCPSVSPENTYILPDGTKGCICYGATMDNEILRDLFDICLAAGNLLHEDETFLKPVREVRSRLPKLKIGTEGQLLEWMEEYEEAEPGHRHVSHLYGLYPSSQIQMGVTPDLTQAAKKTLQRRREHGGGHTGWSRAWMICMYARLWEGEEAYQNLLLLLQNSTLDNLLDYHPPFQIDGNFGAAAGIAEMLLQSVGRPEREKNQVVLLPALPKAWKKGSIRGICTRGGGIFDLSWEDGVLKEVRVRTKWIRYQAELIYGEQKKNVCVEQGKEELILFIL